MGYGDDIMATGMARGAEARGKRIAFGDKRQIIWGPWSEQMFRHNPNIAPPGDEGAPDLEWIAHYKGHRLYNHAERRRWIWHMDFRPRPGEMFFTPQELEFGRIAGSGFILVEPNVPWKKSVAANKDWGLARYQAVTDRLIESGWRVVQFMHGKMRLRGVENVYAPEFRLALSVLSNAELYIGPEGGLHHGAAAVGVPGVVLFGGFIPPQVTGYDTHTNLTGGAKACGHLQHCDHCKRAMAAISVDEVHGAALKALRKGCGVRGPDVYYGAVAKGYDAAREVKAKWQAEQATVEAFLGEGRVLDVPFGTGRFVPLYRAKGLKFTGVDISADMLAVAKQKYPDVQAVHGSVFDLPYRDGTFATAVCVRFLEWLPLDRAKDVIDRLRGLARTLILTITHGVEGEPEAYTYDFGKFLMAIDGLLIEDRRVTAHVRDMISEVFKLRPARWSDALDQFRHDHPDDPGEQMQRIADKHAAFVGLAPVLIDESAVKVRAEYWSAERIGAAVMALAKHRFVTCDMPRQDERPITIVERDGVALIIDGRKRANLWMRQPGPHPVLVMRPNG